MTLIGCSFLSNTAASEPSKFNVGERLFEIPIIIPSLRSLSLYPFQVLEGHCISNPTMAAISTQSCAKIAYFLTTSQMTVRLPVHCVCKPTFCQTIFRSRLLQGGRCTTTQLASHLLRYLKTACFCLTLLVSSSVALVIRPEHSLAIIISFSVYWYYVQVKEVLWWLVEFSLFEIAPSPATMPVRACFPVAAVFTLC